MYLFLVALGLYCRMKTLSSCGAGATAMVQRLLVVVAPLLWSTGLCAQASVVGAHGLSSCDSRALEGRLRGMLFQSRD